MVISLRIFYLFWFEHKQWTAWYSNGCMWKPISIFFPTSLQWCLTSFAPSHHSLGFTPKLHAFSMYTCARTHTTSIHSKWSNDKNSCSDYYVDGTFSRPIFRSKLINCRLSVIVYVICWICACSMHELNWKCPTLNVRRIYEMRWVCVWW